MAKAHRNVLASARGDTSADGDDEVGGINTKPMDRWVASRVRLARQTKNWSQTRLAEVLGLATKRRIEKWENGENRLTAAQLHAVATALDVHPGWFFEDFPAAGAVASPERGEAMQALLDMPELIPFVQALAGIAPEQRASVLTIVRSMSAAGSAPRP